MVGKKEIPYWARVEDVAWPLLRDILSDTGLVLCRSSLSLPRSSIDLPTPALSLGCTTSILLGVGWSLSNNSCRLRSAGWNLLGRYWVKSVTPTDQSAQHRLKAC